MVNFKKIDEKDFVFQNTPLSEGDEKAFSDFLKSRKLKSRRTGRGGKAEKQNLFPEKVKKAEETIAKIGLPKRGEV